MKVLVTIIGLLLLVGYVGSKIDTSSARRFSLGSRSDIGSQLGCRTSPQTLPQR